MISLQIQNNFHNQAYKPKNISNQGDVSFSGRKKLGEKLNKLPKQDKKLCISSYIIGGAASILALFGIINSQIEDTSIINNFTRDVFVRTVANEDNVKDKDLKPIIESIVKDNKLESSVYEKGLIKLANQHAPEIKELHEKLCDAKWHKQRKAALEEFLQKVAPENKDELMEVLTPELKKFSRKDSNDKAMKESSFYASLFIAMMGLLMFAHVSNLVNEENKKND